MFRHQITSVPRVFLYAKGAIVDQLSGPHPERKFRAMIDKVLAVSS